MYSLRFIFPYPSYMPSLSSSDLTTITIYPVQNHENTSCVTSSISHLLRHMGTRYYSHLLFLKLKKPHFKVNLTGLLKCDTFIRLTSTNVNTLKCLPHSSNYMKLINLVKSLEKTPREKSYFKLVTWLPFRQVLSDCQIV